MKCLYCKKELNSNYLSVNFSCLNCLVIFGINKCKQLDQITYFGSKSDYDNRLGSESIFLAIYEVENKNLSINRKHSIINIDELKKSKCLELPDLNKVKNNLQYYLNFT
jgi:hypothetical protein